MLLVVGGNSHNIGKTSVAAAVIQSLPEAGWTAVKITQYDAGECSTGQSACRCDGSEHPYTLLEQTEPASTDSGRFLAAGALRSYWLRTARGNLGYAVPELRKMIRTSRNVLLESNGVLQFLRPDLYLLVLDTSLKDIKDSARWFFNRADAYVLVGDEQRVPPWKGIPARWLREKPGFRVNPPEYSSEELIRFVQSALGKVSPIATLP